jgi:hypothetical protein
VCNCTAANQRNVNTRGKPNAVLTIVSEDDVRDALRCFHDEATFSQCRVGISAQRLYPAASARAAFIAIVEHAFEALPASTEGRRIRDVVFACDLEQALPRETAARHVGVAVRTLFRKRTQAIRIIADHMNAVIASSQSPLPPAILRMLDSDVEPVSLNKAVNGTHDLFAGVRIAFESSRMRGDLSGMQRAIRSLTGARNRLNAREAAELNLMQADLAIGYGRVADAASRLTHVFDVLTTLQSSQLTRKALLAKGRLSFLTGNLSDTTRTAALVHHGNALDEVSAAAVALCGRAALVTGHAWEMPAALPSRAYDRLQLRAVEARHILCRGECTNAYNASLEAHDESMACGFLPLAAYSAATLAAASRAARSSASDHWACQALQLLAACGANTLVACDLFEFPYAAENAVQWFGGAPCTDLQVIYLTIHGTSELHRTEALADSLPLLLRTILLRAYNHEASELSTEALIERLWNSVGCRDRVVHAYASELQRIIAFGDFLKVLVPRAQQPAFERRFRSAASVTIRAVTRSIGYRKIRALSIVS